MLRLWIAFFLGKYTVFSEAKDLRTQEMRIGANPPQYMNVAGEITKQTPITVCLAPEVLKLMVPQSFQDIDESTDESSTHIDSSVHEPLK